MTLIITSYHVLSHFSSTLFALSWESAEVLSFELGHFSSSLLLKNAQKIQANILSGLKEKPFVRLLPMGTLSILSRDLKTHAKTFV